MGLFDKKYCDMCGEKISLLGNRKLEDGNMCSHCAKKISPFMTDRRRTTVAEMKEHLAYREQNKTELAAFQCKAAFGDSYSKFCVDSVQRKFYVGSDNRASAEKENPDVIPFSSVQSCELDIQEHKQEVYIQDSQGNKQRYNPPRYTYDYDFYMDIRVDNRWFDKIHFKLNSSDVDRNSIKFRAYEEMGNKIIAMLTAGEPETKVDSPATQSQPVMADPTPWVCGGCGATNMGNFCEYCGTPKK